MSPEYRIYILVVKLFALFKAPLVFLLSVVSSSRNIKFYGAIKDHMAGTEITSGANNRGSVLWRPC